MGFIRDPSLVEQHGPLHLFLADLRSPQQAVIANKLLERGKTMGLALCIGASISFRIGQEVRAPRWMQQLGMEWLFRLLQDPRRLAKRYPAYVGQEFSGYRARLSLWFSLYVSQSGTLFRQ